MVKPNRLVLWLIFGLLTIASALAVNFTATDIDAFYPLDSTYQATDYFGTYDCTNNGASFSAVGADFEASESDYINCSAAIMSDSSKPDFTLMFWSDIETLSGAGQVAASKEDRNSGDSYFFAQYYNGGTDKANPIVATNSGNFIGDAVVLADTTAHFYTIIWDNSTSDIKFYIDGVEQTMSDESSGSFTSIGGFDAEFLIGAMTESGPSVSRFYDGFLANMSILSGYKMSNSEINDTIAVNGWIPDLLPVAASPENEDSERTVVVELDSPVTINSQNFQTIHSATVTITNATNISITDAVNLIALNRDGDATCRVLWDGVTYNTTKTRSMIEDAYGSMYITSSVFEVTAGDYTVSLECNRDTPSSNPIQIVNSNIVIKELISDRTAQPLNYVASTISESITSATYTKVWAYNFSTTNNTVSSTIRKRLLLDGDLTYTYASTGEISTYLEIDGVNYGEFPRYGTAGTTGSVGAIFEQIVSPLLNVSQNVSLSIWARSTTADGTIGGNAVIKELIIKTPEANTTDLNGSTVASSDYIDIVNLSVENVEHASGNLLVHAGIPLKTSSGTSRATFRITVDGQTSGETIRDITGVNQAGVLIFEETFILGTGKYNVTLQAKSNSSYDVVGGSMTAYMTDRVAAVEDSYNITLYNAFNNSNLQNFNVTNSEGSTFTTSNGVLKVFYNSSWHNLTLAKDGYLSRYITDHNTSNNLSAALWVNELNVTAAKLFEGSAITSFNATLGSVVNNSDAGGIAYFYPNGETYSLSLVAAGYWSRDYSVTFGTETYTNFQANLSTFQLNVTADFFGSGINTFTTTISRLDGDYTQDESLNTTTGTTQYYIEPGTYNISIVADGYAFAYETITLNNTETFHQLNFSLLQTNSFNITFYDEELYTLIDDATITFELISTTFSANYTTTNGTLELNLLTPESYTLRYSGNPDYPQRFNYFVLTNGTYNELSFYLLNTSSATTVTATVYDENNLVVEDAQIKSLRYDINTNSYILQEIVSTNFEGEATMSLQLNTEYYKFIVLYNNEVKLETSPTYITETSLTFSIVLTALAGEDYFTYEGISTDIYYNNNTGNFVYTYDDVSNTASRGCMYVYSVVNTKETLYNSSCANTASGSIVLGIEGVNGTTYRADGYVTISGTDQYTGSASATFGTPSTINTQADALGLWLLMVLFMFVGIFNLTLALLLTPLPLFLGSLLGMLNIPLWATGGLYLMALILAVVLSRRN